MELSGKVALITGGTKGIGAAAAIDLAAAGADIAINGRHDDDQARATLAAVRDRGRRCAFVVADCAVPDEAERCVHETADRLGRVDVLIHSAGGPVPGTIFQVTPDQWRAAFDLHVHAVFFLCRAAIPLMQKAKEGAIVLVSSVAGQRGCPGTVCYQVIKGALPQFARALARDYADDNIRVNVVAPGIIRTRFHANMSPEVKENNLRNRIPLHREGTSEQVATLIRELVTNDYITGETVTIDGGLTMRIV
jgi:NAD(P)-dependent dehydrogenase (short-subunit alcohol dehydrogenase family)